jgi:hypothetical protein
MLLRAVPLYLLGLASLGFAQLPRPTGSDPSLNTSGIAPRPDAGYYPAHESSAGATVAAVLLPANQHHKLFGKNLDSSGYVVLEVAVYPQAGQLTVSPDQFRLQIGDDRTLRRPVEPAEIMGKKQSKADPGQVPGKVNVYHTATVGYESGPYGKGVYTGASTSVGVGNPPPQAAPNPSDPINIQEALVEKEFPDTKTMQPVAGYLYFRKPTAKQKNPVHELTWRSGTESVKLTVPPPPK